MNTKKTAYLAATNYKTIISFNSFLILMGIIGVFTPTVTSFLHNSSTIALSMRSMTNLLEDSNEPY